MKEKNLEEYHDIYLKTYVLLLADVFETFCEMCLEYYLLDPAHLYTAPGFAWKAALKHGAEYCEHEDNVGGFKKRRECKKCPNEFQLELLTDIDKLLIFERSIRGGITQAVKRYEIANNKYMPDYDSEHISKLLHYLDANNLYGLTIVQKLPTHGFRWINKVEELTP